VRKEEQDRLLGQKAIERGWISKEQLADAVQEQNRRAGTRSIGNVLASKGFLTNEQLIVLLEEVKGIPFTAEPEQPGSFPYPFGKYTLIRELGRGGMGIVYEAKDTVLGRKVALKVIRSREGGDAAQVQEETDRFMREARLSANLSKHAHIVGVYDAGAVDGRPYLAMEFIEGSPLSKWRHSPEATLPGLVRILQDVARGVHHAHQHGVIHRDLKPDNILLSAGPQPHVTDFGLAKSLDPQSSGSLTAQGRVMGTPIYMSPEQAQGAEKLDHRTDIYSLGVMLFEALVGRPPFLGNSAFEVLAKTVGEPTPTPSSLAPSGTVDARLEAICLKAIAKDPSRRHASAEEFAAALEGWLGSTAGATAPASPPTAPRPPGPRPAPAAVPPPPAPKPEAAFPNPVSSSGRKGGRWLGFAALLLAACAAGAVFFFVVPPADRQILIARLLSRLGQDEEALRLYDQVLAKYPALPAAVAGRKELLSRRELPPPKAGPGTRSHEPAPGVLPVLPPPAPAPGKEAGSAHPVSDLLAQHPGAVEDAFLAAVAKLSPEDQALAVLEKLKELNPKFTGKPKHKIELGKVVEWTVVTSQLVDLSPLRALPDLTVLEIPAELEAPANRFLKSHLTDLSPLHGMPLRRLRISGTSVRDLSVLHGMPLASLRCDWTEVSDLSPLVGTPLTFIEVAATPVTDLSPLSGLPLETINCAFTKVSDFTPLRSLPLKKLFMRNTKVTDLNPIRYCPLTVLRLDYLEARDAPILRSMKTLVEINDLPAAEFLFRFARPWTSIFDGRSTEALMLQPKEAWQLEKEVLLSVGKECSLLTREEFEDGEFRIRFRAESVPFLSIAVRHSVEKGFSVVPEIAPPGAPRGKLRDHELLFTCKEDQVTALLDGQPAPLKFKNGPRRGPLQIHVMGGGHFALVSIERR
jgi:serine/threonine protein kinase